MSSKKPDFSLKNITKKVKLGNDKRQFILRIPTEITNNSLLDNFDDKYTAEVIFDTKKKDEIIVRFKKNDN